MVSLVALLPYPSGLLGLLLVLLLVTWLTRTEKPLVIGILLESTSMVGALGSSRVRRYVAAVSVVSVLCFGMALMAMSGCASGGRGPRLDDRATEAAIFASAAEGRTTLSMIPCRGRGS